MTDLTIQQASRHAVYVQRFAGHLANGFDPYLESLQRELKIIMIDAPEETQNIRVINKLISDYKKASLAVYADYNDSVLIDGLKEFSGDEASWQAAALDKAVESPTVNLSTPSIAQAWASVVAEPLVFPDSSGVKLLEPFIKGWESNQIQKVSDIIRTGFITGRTNAQITQDIAGKGGYLDNKNRKSIKSMVRTATTHTSNLARQATFEANDDVILGYEWVSTLDINTSSTCKGLDGKVFKNSDKNKRYPPAHPNCRSGTAPVLDARYRLDDSVNTRASRGVEGGQQVNADTTYYGWLKEQGAQGKDGRAFVLDVLGKERGKLFLDGGLTADKFKQLTLDELFQPIPLDTLRKKQSLQLAFDKAGTAKSKPIVKAAKAKGNIESISNSSKKKYPPSSVNVVNSTGGVVSKGKKGTSTITKAITDDESAYLEYYKGEGFYKNNNILRDTAKYTKQEVDSAKTMLNAIDSAVAKSSLDSDTLLYRGIRDKELFNAIDDASIGASIPINTPQSFTKDGRVSLTYSGAIRAGNNYVSAGNEAVILRLNAKAGQAALDMESLRGIGNTSESEMLISSKGKYKIIGFEEKLAPDGSVSMKIIDVEYEDNP